ncbi:unnamed protein product [marine sediment metagenome]|uniref:Uncharacterized protein n=1 Tax=marine sediment metagenome TaxID=412755 RepID=X1A062_9ZZZZ
MVLSIISIDEAVRFAKINKKYTQEMLKTSGISIFNKKNCVCSSAHAN